VNNEWNYSRPHGPPRKPARDQRPSPSDPHPQPPHAHPDTRPRNESWTLSMRPGPTCERVRDGIRLLSGASAPSRES
jgi:hypothetical protein